MQDLGSAFWGFALTKAPFTARVSQKAPIPIFQNYSHRGAPWKCSRGRCLPPSGPKGGWPQGSRAIWPLVGTRATHMMPDACWARNLLTVLHLRPSRLAIIVSPWVFGPALTSYRIHRCTSNFPTDGANCRVTVFGPSPLQWICREWVQKLGSDKATARSEERERKNVQNRTAQRVQGEGTISLED